MHENPILRVGWNPPNSSNERKTLARAHDPAWRGRGEDYTGYSILDMAGATILESSVPNAQINLSWLAAGSYLLKIHGIYFSSMFRIVRQ